MITFFHAKYIILQATHNSKCSQLQDFIHIWMNNNLPSQQFSCTLNISSGFLLPTYQQTGLLKSENSGLTCFHMHVSWLEPNAKKTLQLQ